MTGEGAYCSTSTKECTVAEIHDRVDRGPQIGAVPGHTLRLFGAWQNPNEPMWTSLNLSSMSTSQLQALLGAAQRQGLFALAQFVRAELQRRKDEENKRKKQKDSRETGQE